MRKYMQREDMKQGCSKIDKKEFQNKNRRTLSINKIKDTL